jgi:hypothetical protein
MTDIEQDVAVVGSNAPPPRPKMPPEIAAAIVKAMGMVKRLENDAENKFQHYKYASVDAFFEALGPILSECKIFSIPHEISSDVMQLSSTDDRGVSKTSNWLVVNYSMVIYHESGVEFALLPKKIQVAASGPQSYGSWQSYAEKFVWKGLLKIPTGDADVDDMDQRGLPERRNNGQRIKEPPREMYSVEKSAAAREVMLSELPLCSNRGLLASWFARHDAEGALMTVEDCNLVAAAYNAKRVELEAADGKK